MKIRGIKPEFWTDEKVVEVSAYARLLFLGLWNMACDNGHLEDSSRRIKMTILPADDVSAADLLRELEAIGLIVREDGWITIPTLPKHQKIDRRYFRTCDHPDCQEPPLKSEPEAPKPNAERKTRRAHTVVTTTSHRDHAADSDGDGDGEKKTQPSVEKRSPRGSRITPDWQPSQKVHDDLGVEYTDLDLPLQLASFRDYWLSKGEPRKDWDAAFRNWCRKAREYGRRPTPIGQRKTTNGLTDDEWQQALDRALAADRASGAIT